MAPWRAVAEDQAPKAADPTLERQSKAAESHDRGLHDEHAGV
jgi:hypothetical protein